MIDHETTDSQFATFSTDTYVVEMDVMTIEEDYLKTLLTDTFFVQPYDALNACPDATFGVNLKSLDGEALD